MAEQVAEEAEKTEVEENLPEEVLESDTVKQFADVGSETDSIIEAPVKTFVSVRTQTEPLDVFIGQPVAELTSEKRRRNVVLDHPYTRKPEQDVDPQNAETNVEPGSLAVQQIRCSSMSLMRNGVMTLMTQAQSAAVTSQIKIGTPKNMKIPMTKVQISFITQAAIGLKKMKSRASQLFLIAV